MAWRGPKLESDAGGREVFLCVYTGESDVFSDENNGWGGRFVSVLTLIPGHESDLPYAVDSTNDRYKHNEYPPSWAVTVMEAFGIQGKQYP